MIIEVNPDHPQPRRIAEAVRRLEAGELVAYPTDTVYAIGCDVRNKKAVERVQKLKMAAQNERKSKRILLSIIVPDLRSLADWAIVDDHVYRLLKRATPGPYTFILKASRKAPRVLLNKQKTIGLRVPDCPVAVEMARQLRSPIITTTAKFDGEMLSVPREIERAYNGQVSAVVDSGPLFPQPSTVIDMTGPVPELVRQGKGELDSIGFI